MTIISDGLSPAILRAVRIRSFDPTRTPDWRWQRVRTLVDHPGGSLRPAPIDDEFVKLTRTYLVYSANAAPDQKAQLQMKYAQPYLAIQIHDGQDERLRTYIQARLLAGQTAQEIAQAVGTTPVAVEWFEALFYNVTDRLENHDWICRQIFGGPETAQAGEAKMLKAMGYFHGPLMLDLLIPGSIRPDSQPQTPEQMQAWLDVQTRIGLRRQALIEAFDDSPVSASDMIKLFELWIKMKQQESAQADRVGPVNLFEQNLAVFLNELPWATGSAAEARLATEQPLVAEHDSAAAERRDDELLSAGAGVELPSMSKALRMRLRLPGEQVVAGAGVVPAE